MAALIWLSVVGLVVNFYCVKSHFSDLTSIQFASFVGGSSYTRDIGTSFQSVRSRMSPTAKHRVPASEAGVKGVCEEAGFKCDPHYPYRTADGSCNNLAHPTWGKAAIPLRRWITPAYGDGKSTPRTHGKYGYPLPSARYVSTTVHGTHFLKDIPKDERITHMVMQWGHYLDHDITHAPVCTLNNSMPMPIDCCADGAGRFPCFAISIPQNDPFFKDKRCFSFIRSVQGPNADCMMEPVEQLNEITAFVDSSNVYGSGDKANLRLGANGLLKTGDYGLLPDENGETPVVPCDAHCFDAGDVRRNEQMGLTSMHTLFMREHNRIARTLKKYNPHWGDERLFQESRKIVGAIAQKVTYVDWLKIILDPQTRRENHLDSPPGYEDIYDPKTDPSIRNAFGTAAFRFGHSMVRSKFSRRNPDYTMSTLVQTSDIFGKTSILRHSSGQAVEQFLRGLVFDRVSKTDRFITPELLNKLFKSPTNSLDLIAFNIQRGRDHGTAPYNAWREWCGLPKARKFTNGLGGFIDHSSGAVRQLALAYSGLSPHDVDLFPAAISEKPLPGGILGPTFACMVGRQFGNIKKGDRFWFKLPRPYTRFTPGQLRELEKASLGRIICDNTRTFYIQRNVFRRAYRRNQLRECHALPRVDLRQWREHIFKWYPIQPVPVLLFG